MATEPINLEVVCGNKFRIFMSEDHENGKWRDPWNFELRGPNGSKVWPYSANLLCAYTIGSFARRKKLLLLGEAFQVGDGFNEAVVRFSLENIEPVAKHLKLYVRKTLGDGQRLKAIERLRVCRLEKAALDA